MAAVGGVRFVFPAARVDSIAPCADVRGGGAALLDLAETLALPSEASRSALRFVGSRQRWFSVGTVLQVLQLDDSLLRPLPRWLSRTDPLIRSVATIPGEDPRFAFELDVDGLLGLHRSRVATLAESNP